MLACKEIDMTNENAPSDSPSPSSDVDAGSGPANDFATPKSDRDFGDSAGYGSGGSTLDHRDVGDEGASGTAGKRNPLDDVVNLGDAADCLP
jgi:hypothetical protein